MTLQGRNRKLVEDFLSEKYGDGKIEKVVDEILNKKGNCASQLLKVLVDLDIEDVHKRQSYIVKSCQESSFGDYAKTTLFPKETEMYATIIPQLENAYREHEIEIDFSPKCFKIESDSYTILLEDLNYIGYKTINHGMDRHHMEATLAKLAKFHAASASVFQKQDALSERFPEGLYQEEMFSFYEEMFNRLWPLIRSNMVKWEGCEEFVKKLDLQNQHAMPLLMESLRIDTDEFNVLNHGDFNCNNIMFKYADDDDGHSIEDVRFIDFQLCKWGSPVQDLWHLIGTSCSLEELDNFDYLIKFYHRHLVESLELLGYSEKVPALKELKEALKRRGYYGVNVTLSILPAILSDDGVNIRVGGKIYSNPKYKEAMCKFLRLFDKWELLD